MISKNLFYNLIREDWKQKIWVIALTVLSFFFVLPVNMMMVLGDNAYYLDQLQTIFHFEFLENYALFFVTMGIAFLVSMQGFSYLHSKKQVDFYHGIPVKREMLFAVKFINGILIYVIPLLVFTGISLLIGFSKGISLTENDFLVKMLWMLLVSVLFYILNFIVMIIAILLTGHIITSVFAIGTLLLYGPVFILIFQLLMNNFFITSYSSRGRSDALQSMRYLSPMTAYAGEFDGFSRLTGSNLLGCMITFLVVMALIAILVGLSVFLYRKRSSENAGRAIAFPKSEPVLKLLLVILFSLAGGIFMEQITYNAGVIGWYCFGVITVYIISSAMIEIIFAFDFKKVFANKKIWIINAGILLLINSVFLFDILGIDTYLPSSEQVASMSVNFSGMDNEIYTIDNNNDWKSIGEIQLSTMNLTDFKELYELSANSVNEIKQSNRFDLIEARGDGIITSEDEVNARRYMSVKYRLKSGKEVIRGYSVDILKEQELISKIYTNPQYLSATYKIQDDVSFDEVYFREKFDNDNADDIQIPFTTAGIEELSNIYEKEILGLTLECNREMIPLGNLIFAKSKGETKSEVPIYPFCTETIQYIEEATGGNLILQRPLEPGKVLAVRASFAEVDREYIPNRYGTQAMAYRTIKIGVDETQIQEIFNKCYPSRLTYNNSYWQFFLNQEIEVSITYIMDEIGNTTERSVRFANDDIPQFILDAQKEAKLKYEEANLSLGSSSQIVN